MSEVIGANVGMDNTERENDHIAKQIYLLYESAVSESHLHQDIWPILSAEKLCKKVIE